jgi:hypothetical protein
MPTRKGSSKQTLSGYQKTKKAGAQIIPIKLPLAYLKVLDSEATLMRDRRGQLLEKLLRRKLGEFSYERPANGPTYSATDKELTERKVWTWYIHPDLRQLVERDRLQMGLPSFGSWIVTMLNQWIGQPGGLPTKRR